ncbi:MAG: low molecular weight protein arginine phosphatase [Promethearchaeia archaeon]
MIKKILIICYGNTARSPAAEYLARHYARQYDIDIKVQSAGFINAFSDMQPLSKEYLKEKGIDPSDFRPQTINRILLEEHDLIITMEKSHKRDILRDYSYLDNLENRIYTLKEFTDNTKDLDIIDPYYESSEKFQEILEIIDKYVEKMVKKLKK